MKNVVLLFGIGFMVFACKSDKIDLKPNEKLIEYNKSINLLNGKLTFSTIQDSRCPSDPSIFCFSGGAATVGLKYISSQGPGQDKSVQLCLGECGREKANPETGKPEVAKVNLDGINYFIELIEVNPYPVTVQDLLAENKKKYIIKLNIQNTP